MIKQRQIEDFAAPVLSRYIRQHIFLRDIVADLTKLEATVEYERIQSKIQQICYAKREPLTIKDPQALINRLEADIAESKKLDRLWKRSDELMLVMFPKEEE